MCRPPAWRTLSGPMRLLDDELNFVGGVKLGHMIHGRSEFERVVSRLNTRQSSLLALEHPHELSVHVRVNMMSLLAFDQLELKRNLITFNHLPLLRG
jgi:hypothetical protein